MQVVNDQVEVEAILEQPVGGLRDVSYQLYCGDDILESAFEQRQDKLCVARQLAELMPAAAGGAVGLRRDLPEQQVAGAGRQPQGDPRFLRVARGPDVLRGLPGPPARQVGAGGQGAAGRGLHRLERPRLLLQVRPHRREARADWGAGQVPGRQEAERSPRVQGVAGVGG